MSLIVSPYGRSLSFTFVDSAASADSSNITVPAAAQAGDLGVMFDVTLDTTEVTPSGHTAALTDGPEADSWLKVSYKILTGSEPGNPLTGMNGSQETKKYLVFRPSRSIVSVVSPTWGAEQTPNNPSQQTVSASGQTPPLIVFGLGFCNSNNSFNFSNQSPAFDDVIVGGGDNGRLIIGYKIYNTAPANHSIDMSDQGSGNWLASGYLRFV